MKKTFGLYFVKDLVSGVPTSAVITCINDALAIRGFLKMLENDQIAKEEQQLVRIGEIDDDYKIVSDIYEPVCTGDKAEDVYKMLTADIRGEENE